MARKVIHKNIAFDDVKRLYYVNMDFGKDEKGKRIKKAKTFKTEKDAKRALKIFEADRLKNMLVMPSDETVDSYAHYWLSYEKSEVRETTRYTYLNIINNHIAPYFGTKPMQSVRKEDIYKYFNHLKTEKQLSVNSIRKHYDILKSVFTSAVQSEKIYTSPLKTIKAPKTESFESKIYTPGQILELFKAAEGDRIEIAVHLAVYLGLRRGEVCALRWKRVDFERGTIDIVDNRTLAGGKIYEGPVKSENSERRLKIPDGLMPLLHRIRTEQAQNKERLKSEYYDGDYVFCNQSGKPYRPNYLSKLFSKLLEKHDLEHIRFHDLRHTHGSIAILGAPLYDVSKSLGHSRQEITQRIYLKDIFDVKSAAVDSVDKTLKQHSRAV